MARSFLLFLFFAVAWPVRAATGLPRPRVPRLLRLVDGAGAPLRGDCFAPQFVAKGDGIFFLRNENGARTLWFTAPPAPSKERYPAWRATPVWQPRAPFQLSEVACFRGDSSAFIATGSRLGGAATQLWRVGSDHRPKVLWNGRERVAHPALSPDGSTVVFTRYFRDERGQETPQLWRTRTSSPNQKPVLVFKSARRGFWLDAKTVVFERLLGNETAFYSINPSAPTSARLLLRGSGEGAPLGNGAGLVFAAGSPTTSLFVLARDGSGLHTLVGTEGARRPAVSPDQTRFTFDAPDPQTRSLSLWLTNLDPAQEESETPVFLRPVVAPRARVVRCEIEPMPLPPPADPALPSTPDPTPIPPPAPTPEPTQTPNSQDADKADMDVAGTLATAPRGGKMHVVFWAKNRGTRAWTGADVRVVVRWVDFDAGTRRRWEFKWMRGTIAPLGQTRLPLDVTIPAQAGRYKVIYSLIRLPSKNAKVTPPPYNSSQDAWPGEFAATAFAVNVN